MRAMIKVIVVVQLCAMAYPSCMTIKTAGEFEKSTSENCTKLIVEVMAPAIDRLHKATGMPWFIRNGECYSNKLAPGTEV